MGVDGKTFNIPCCEQNNRIIRAQATQEHVIVGGVYIYFNYLNSALLAFEYSALIILQRAIDSYGV
jgi:hypothetical protein